MAREINLDSIRALEKQIEEHEKAIIQLKRTRNSLLNVSTLLPPEMLVNVFRWNVIPDGDFGGLLKGSYNFLLVCHHWFEVASRAPGLWRSWGNSIEDWKRRCARCGTGPLDLVLDKRTDLELDDKLRDALQDRATRDTIRRVHLRAAYGEELLRSVISSIVTEGEETRTNSVESFIVQSGGVDAFVDVSGFFSRYHLPKLKRLHLSGCKISSWDLLKSKTATLTTLWVTIGRPSAIPTLSQLLSILSSNPLLQDLALFYSLDPHAVDRERSSPLVPLHHLKNPQLSSLFHDTFLLTSRLELPDKMNSLDLILFEYSPSDLSQVLGPYLRDRIRRRGNFTGDGLGLLVDHTPYNLRFSVGDAHKHDDCNDFAQVDWFATVCAYPSESLGKKGTEKMCFDLIAHIPREHVITLQATLRILRLQELCVEMCNLTYLHLNTVDLSTLFVDPDVLRPHVSEDLLHSLDHIVIVGPTLSGGDWSPLTNFLSRRAVAGNPISSLRLRNHPPMDDDVVGSIERAVNVFEREHSGENGGSEGSDEGDESEGGESDESDH